MNDWGYIRRLERSTPSLTEVAGAGKIILTRGQAELEGNGDMFDQRVYPAYCVPN